MINAVQNWLFILLPSGAERYLMTAGGLAGAAFSFLFGDSALLLEWLMLFIALDFITGTVGALRTGEWTSREFTLGIFRKVFYFCIVALAHGLDVVFQPLIHVAIIEDVVICAYAAGEFGSIIENMDRCGLAGAVPEPVRKLIYALNHKVDDTVEKISEKKK